MRKYYLIQILYFLTIGCFAQHSYPGLEGVIVEKYYVTGKADIPKFDSPSHLPVGSTTYRIYLDLDSGYRFQAAYGSPEHALVIKSDALIYNHPESGYTHPNIQPLRSLRKNTALLDSWISVGAASEKHFGIPISYDSNGRDTLIPQEAGYFLNTNKSKSPSIQEIDGMQYADKLPYPTFFQIDSCLAGLGSETKTNEIIIRNGAWACLGKGSCGADSTTTNTVLIAQITTAGQLEFDLNIMIGGPDGKSIRYVANNPKQDEIEHPALHYRSNKANKKDRARSKKKKDKTTDKSQNS